MSGLCHALEEPCADISWRCSRPSGHYPETPHAYVVNHVTHHEWVDE